MNSPRFVLGVLVIVGIVVVLTYGGAGSAAALPASLYALRSILTGLLKPDD